MLTDWHGRGEQRVAELVGSVDVLRTEIADWVERRRAQDAYRRFARHFQLVVTVLDEMLAATRGTADTIAGDAAHTYAECRRLDACLTVARRFFFWYATKYDQRTNPRLGAVLSAADELVRSCWTEPFVAAGRPVPAAPLAYVDDRFDAYATARVSPPTDLRAPADSLVAAFVRELPVPTIALPADTARRVWWCVLAAHETGHHVEFELDGLAGTAKDAVGSAVPEDLRPLWRRWSSEVFADAFAVFMVGPEAVWAIDELQLGTAEPPARPGTRYPPPAVRLALSCQLAGVRPAVDPHIAAVATALTDLPIAGRALRTVARTDEVAPKVAAWTAKLLGLQPRFVGLDNRIAARIAIAAGVRAFLSLAGNAGGRVPEAELDGLHEKLVHTLRSCGEPGVLAAPPTVTDPAALASRFARRLLADTTPEVT